MALRLYNVAEVTGDAVKNLSPRYLTYSVRWLFEGNV